MPPAGSPELPAVPHLIEKESEMSPKQIQLVQESFAKVQPIAAQAAKMFDQRLFELDPKLKKLFKGDMVAQGVKLMSMIAAAVKGLSNVD